MRSKRWMVTVIASAALLGSMAGADQLTMAPVPSGSANQPRRGMSMDKVEATFGAPTNRVAAVGNPPITRWEYPGFVVYFEHNLVVHSVARL